MNEACMVQEQKVTKGEEMQKQEKGSRTEAEKAENEVKEKNIENK